VSRWYGETAGNFTNAEAAYDWAAANIAESTNQFFPTTFGAEGLYSDATIEDEGGGYFSAGIVVSREYATYAVSNLPPIPHSVDVLACVTGIPPAQRAYDVNGEFACDIPGAVRGVAWIVTNIPTSTATSHTITFRVPNTNAPTPGEYPSYAETITNSTGVGYGLRRGFQSPKLQAVIKWEVP
jgi:hypothetical protein